MVAYNVHHSPPLYIKGNMPDLLKLILSLTVGLFLMCLAVKLKGHAHFSLTYLCVLVKTMQYCTIIKL